MRQGGWQQRRGKSSTRNYTRRNGRETLIWRKREKEGRARANFLERDPCLSRLSRNSHFPVLTPPFTASPPHPTSQLSSILPLSFHLPSRFHSEGPRGITTFAVFSLISKLSRSPCVFRLIKGLSPQRGSLPLSSSIPLSLHPILFTRLEKIATCHHVQSSQCQS